MIWFVAATIVALFALAYFGAPLLVWTAAAGTRTAAGPMATAWWSTHGAK